MRTSLCVRDFVVAPRAIVQAQADHRPGLQHIHLAQRHGATHAEPPELPRRRAAVPRLPRRGQKGILEHVRARVLAHGWSLSRAKAAAQKHPPGREQSTALRAPARCFPTPDRVSGCCSPATPSKKPCSMVDSGTGRSPLCTVIAGWSGYQLGGAAAGRPRYRSWACPSPLL